MAFEMHHKLNLYLKTIAWRQSNLKSVVCCLMYLSQPKRVMTLRPSTESQVRVCCHFQWMERRGRARLGGRSGRSAMGGLLPTSCLARGDQGGAECGAPTFNITPPQMEFCNKCTDPNGAKYTIYKIQNHNNS